MNNFEDERIDKIIKSKMQKDNYISDQANSVFDNFKHSEIRNKENKTENIKQNTVKTGKNKVVQLSFYQKMNRVLSVAAVSLTVVLVGGTALYLNRDGQNNQDGSANQSIVYNQKYLIKNEPMLIENQQVVKESENGFVKAYLVGKRDVGINLTSTYWNEFDGEFKSTDCYKIDNITKNVSDILVGEIGGHGLPYLFLLMEDGTIEYVDLKCMYNNTFYFVSTKLEGLNNVAGLEQKSRKFSYSNNDYEYVNAIRKDGFRKEIEIGVINDWNDDVIENFDSLNQKYINAHNKSVIPDDGKGDFEVDGKHYYTADIDNRFIYYLKGPFMGNNLYRVERSTGKEICMAEGIGGMARNNSDGRISFYVNEDYYIIYEFDDNIIFRHRDESIISRATESNKQGVTENNKEQEINKPNIEELSEFERRVYESGNYYYSQNGHYCIKNPRETNIAYYIEYNCLYRVIIPNNDSSTCVATYVDDIRVDNENNLIVTVEPNCSVSDLHEGNVIFKEYCVTDSPIEETYSNENVEITLKKDGSLTIRVLEGGLARLGFDSESTTIEEDVYYNMYGSVHGVENVNTHLYYASAKKGILAKAGKNSRLCFVYEKSDGNVIAIDLLNAIQCGSFTGARTSQCYMEGTIEKLYVAEYAEDRDNNGNLIPPYETVFVLNKRENGEERIINLYMPCEDEE